MIYILSILIAFLCIFNGALNVSADFIEDYCWRDFDDVIPSDALIAGEARDGTPIYIGQVLYDNKLIPGKIHHNSSSIHIEFKKVHVLNETIKILCTKHPEKFVWLKTGTGNVIEMQNKHIFEGGYEKGVITYIGRTISHGELTVGKVICWAYSHCIPLTTIESGRWYDHNTFEILTFDDSITIKNNTQSSTTTATSKPATSESTILSQPKEKALLYNNNSTSNNKATSKNNDHKNSSYTSEPPHSISALSICLLVATVALLAGAIVFFVKRC